MFSLVDEEALAERAALEGGEIRPIWYGKKAPSFCQPLTLEWFKTTMTPRFTVTGEALRTLTPPKKDGFPWAGLLLLSFAIAITVFWFNHVFNR